MGSGTLNIHTSPIYFDADESVSIRDEEHYIMLGMLIEYIGQQELLSINSCFCPMVNAYLTCICSDVISIISMHISYEFSRYKAVVVSTNIFF